MRRSRVQRVLVFVVVAALLGWLAIDALQHRPTAPGVSIAGTASPAATPDATATTVASPAARPKSPLPSTAKPSSAIDPVSQLRWADLAQLPAEAADTMREIENGPPFRYPRNDGVTYHNFNKVLPAQPDGYYLEFTVVTPGADTRSARRIVTGGPERGQRNAEFYYTGDHYDTFVRIRV